MLILLPMHSIAHMHSVYTVMTGAKNGILALCCKTKSVEQKMAEVSDSAGITSIYCNVHNEGGYQVEAIDENKGAGFITPHRLKILCKQVKAVREVWCPFQLKVKLYMVIQYSSPTQAINPIGLI